MSSGNGQSRIPVEILDAQFRPTGDVRTFPQLRKRPLWPALVLFALTVISTLTVGSEFALSYAQNREPFSASESLVATMLTALSHPRLLVLGIPFSFTLLTILLAHELGHYFACKFYGIDVSYPYFIPAPTLFGTFGAFIRIRSPITTRRALFDVGFSGPLVGFLLAVPAIAWGIAQSKIVPGVEANAPVVFGSLPLVRLLIALFHPHIRPEWMLLNPMARAAWVGLFVTGLNLLPVWQLDGGHIVYSVSNRIHWRVSLAVALGLLLLGKYAWPGWYLWGGLLLVLALRFRHPPVYDQWQPLDPSRRLLAVAALLMFILCFTPWPVVMP
jgi:membrane-associated protease RseP (regulator of RpoE activity)